MRIIDIIAGMFALAGLIATMWGVVFLIAAANGAL